MLDLVCLSHVPWTLALERPHQIMRRLAGRGRVLFVEDGDASPSTPFPNVTVCGLASMGAATSAVPLRRPVLWVYAPWALGAAHALSPSLLVYDCADEHAARRGAPIDTRAREADLLARADVVFTAGDALFATKRGRNVSTYPVPSGVDAEHFATEPSSSSRRRVGFLGTIDERVDLGLVDAVARALPEVKIELVGPIAPRSRLREADLPRRANLRWLGERPYDELPRIVSRWRAGFVPWRVDEATLRVEPPGLLACVAAGVPVIAPPLASVVERYVDSSIVEIADPSWFADAIERAVRRAPKREAAQDLARKASWDRTAKVMTRLVTEAAMGRALNRRRD